MSAVDVTELARDSVGALSAIGPVALLATCLALAVVVATPRGRSAWMLGRRGLHGRRPSPRRQLVMGLAIPLIAVTATSVSLAFERELREGPNRVLHQLVGGEGNELSWLMQADTRHFMNDSRLPAKAVAELRRSPATALYWSQLSDLTPRAGRPITALIIARSGPGGRGSVPVAVDPATARCRVAAGACVLACRRGGHRRRRGAGRRDGDAARAPRCAIVAHTGEGRRACSTGRWCSSRPAAFDRAGGTREAPFAAVAGGAAPGARRSTRCTPASRRPTRWR